MKSEANTQYRIYYLDVLRFVAAAAVVIQHIAETTGDLGKTMVAAVSPGVFGVVLFFVISGFVIPMTAVKSFDLRSFVIRRFFRIFPLIIFTFCLLAILGFSGVIPSFAFVRSATASDWILNLLLINEYVGVMSLWGVTWTLSLEIAWYILFALSIRFIGRDFDRVLILVFPCMMLLLLSVSLVSDHRLPLMRINLVYVALLGCRVYRYREGQINTHILLRDASVFLIITSMSSYLSFSYFNHPNITFYQALIPWMAAPSLFMLIVCRKAVRNSSVTNSTTLAWLGAISFSIYLLHPLAMAISQMFFTGLSYALSAIVMTFLLSVLGYYAVEIPGQLVGRKVIQPS